MPPPLPRIHGGTAPPEGDNERQRAAKRVNISAAHQAVMSAAIDAPRTDHPLAHLDQLTRKRKAFLHALVWKGAKVPAAAEAAGFSEQAGYLALRDPKFSAALEAELKVRRKSSRLGNIPALERVRDESANSLAVVQAVKALEMIAGQDDDRPANAASSGYVIMIPGMFAADHPIADLAQVTGKPLIELQSVPVEREERVSDTQDDSSDEA